MRACSLGEQLTWLVRAESSGGGDSEQKSARRRRVRLRRKRPQGEPPERGSPYGLFFLPVFDRQAFAGAVHLDFLVLSPAEIAYVGDRNRDEVRPVHLLEISDVLLTLFSSGHKLYSLLYSKYYNLLISILYHSLLAPQPHPKDLSKILWCSESNRFKSRPGMGIKTTGTVPARHPPLQQQIR